MFTVHQLPVDKIITLYVYDYTDMFHVSVMAGKLSDHWQDGKTLQECNLYLMENEFSDITFRLYYKDKDKR